MELLTQEVEPLKETITNTNEADCSLKHAECLQRWEILVCR